MWTDDKQPSFLEQSYDHHWPLRGFHYDHEEETTRTPSNNESISILDVLTINLFY